MSSKVLHEAVTKIKDELHLLGENSPNVDRSSTVSRDVLDNLFCYTETLKEREKRKEPDLNFAVLADNVASESSDVQKDGRS